MTARIPTLSFILCLLSPAFGAETSKCRHLVNKVDLHRRQLEEFTRLAQDLESKYQRYVAADFSAQAEGVFDTLSRNKAIKVVYARKRLKKSVSETKLAMSTTESQYCSECQSEGKNPATRAQYCSRCEEQSLCKKSP